MLYKELISRMKRTLFTALQLLTVSVGSVSCPVSALGGAPLWTNRYIGPGFSCAFAVAADANGNAYVTGGLVNGSGPSAQSDYVTIKYSVSGVPMWTNRYIGPRNNSSSQYPGSSGEVATAILVDGNGDVLVTGESPNSLLGQMCIATLKYSSTGVPLWTNRFIHSASGNARGQFMATDGSGNVYVTGGEADYATIKYSNSGVPIWTNLYSGSANSFDLARCVALDGEGNVFVTGYAQEAGRGRDFATIKYSNGGVPLWTNHYNGTANGDDRASALVVDGAGNVIVTGWAADLASSNNFVTIAYSNAGSPLWTNIYDGPVHGADAALSMAVDAGGTIFVSGMSNDGDTNTDIVTIAYSNAGVALWTNRYDGGLGNGVDGMGLKCTAVDGFGNVHVACYSFGSGGSYDYAVITYSVEGEQLQTERFSRTTGSYDRPWCLTTDSNGNIYVTGESSDSYLTIKYAPTGVLRIKQAGSDAVVSWPNPAFGLQSSPSVTGLFTNIPGAISPYTNATIDSHRYFRLKAD